MKEKLTYKIKGKEYLLMEEVVTGGDSDKLNKKVKKCKAIAQGVKEIKTGFFSGYAILKYLVPVDSLNKWEGFAVLGEPVA